MTFQAARERDAAFIVSRTTNEFGAEIKFWDADLDPEVDDATLTVRGVRFGQAHDRREDSDGQGELRTVMVTVTKADVASIDNLGYMAVNGVVYSIRSAHDDDDVTWQVKGSRDEMNRLGDAASLFGG